MLVNWSHLPSNLFRWKKHNRPDKSLNKVSTMPNLERGFPFCCRKKKCTEELAFAIKLSQKQSIEKAREQIGYIERLPHFYRPCKKGALVKLNPHPCPIYRLQSIVFCASNPILVVRSHPMICFQRKYSYMDVKKNRPGTNSIAWCQANSI